MEIKKENVLTNKLIVNFIKENLSDTEDLNIRRDSEIKIRINADPDKAMELVEEYLSKYRGLETVYFKICGNLKNLLAIKPETLTFKSNFEYNKNYHHLIGHSNNYKDGDDIQDCRISGVFPYILILAEPDIEKTVAINAKINKTKPLQTRFNILANYDELKDDKCRVNLSSVIFTNNARRRDINVLRESAIVYHFNNDNKTYSKDFDYITLGKDAIDTIASNEKITNAYEVQSLQLKEIYKDDKYFALYNKQIIDKIKKAVQKYLFGSNDYFMRLDKVDTSDILLFNQFNLPISKMLKKLATEDVSDDEIISVLLTNTNKEDFIGISLKEMNTERMGGGYSYFETVCEYDYYAKDCINFPTKSEMFLRQELKDVITHKEQLICAYFIDNFMQSTPIELTNDLTIDAYEFYKLAYVAFFKVISYYCAKLGYKIQDYVWDDLEEQTIASYEAKILGEKELTLKMIQQNVTTMEGMATLILYDYFNILEDKYNVYEELGKYCAATLFNNDLYNTIFVKNGEVHSYPVISIPKEKMGEVIYVTNGWTRTKAIKLGIDTYIDDIHFTNGYIESLSDNKLTLKLRR